VAQLLDISGLDHRQGRLQYQHARGPRQRGQAVVSLLVALSPERYERLLIAGHLAGVWGRPFRLDPHSGRRRPIGPGLGAPMSFALSPPARPP
jgi:hypothetical protein